MELVEEDKDTGMMLMIIMGGVTGHRGVFYSYQLLCLLIELLPPCNSTSEAGILPSKAATNFPPGSH